MERERKRERDRERWREREERKKERWRERKLTILSKKKRCFSYKKKLSLLRNGFLAFGRKVATTPLN